MSAGQDIEQRHEQAARALLAADRTGTPIAPLTAGWPELSIEDAYEVQRVGRALRVADGAVLSGRKVGLTSVAMQTMLGVDQPDFGYLTEAMLHRSGAQIAPDALIAPRVEAEIAFRIGRELAGDALTEADVLAATVEVAPALEVIDSRVADWKITIADTIADNASSGCVVLGEFRPLGELDLAAVEMELVVGPAGGREREREHGRGDAVLGHPAQALVWLARALAPFGERIAAGEVVLPGAMGRALPLTPGDTATARMPGLGDVTVTMTMEGRS
jgi:2-keto-4-pentenoate hydratase